MNSEVKALWDKATAAAARGEEIRKKGADESRDLTAEELQNVQKAFGDYRSFKTMAESALEAESIKADLSKAVEFPLFGERKSEPARAVVPRGTFSKRDAVLSYITGGFNGIPAELKAGLVGEGKAFGETSNEAGGYLISEEMATFIISKRMAVNVLRGRCTVIPTRAASFRIPTFVDETNPAPVSEGGTVSETSIIDAFGKIQLTPAKHSLLWKIA